MRARFSIVSALFAFLLVSGCGTPQKLDLLKSEGPGRIMSLYEEKKAMDYSGELSANRDSLTVTGSDGRKLIIMRAARDEDGEMVATDVIDAAYISARFRNVAERDGKVDLRFRITVPKSMQDVKWQLRLVPKLKMDGWERNLDSILVTGADYRKAQMRGYERYRKFVESIVTDTSIFINKFQLELFLKRNLPQIWEFRSDTSYVSETQFLSAFGVSEKEAIDHYTNSLKTGLNRWKKRNKGRMFSRFIPDPIANEGLRLDSVITGENGDILYDYVQTVATGPKTKKATIVLGGIIRENGRTLYTLPANDSLDFYISSFSTLTDKRTRYMQKIIYRNVLESQNYRIRFRAGRYDIDAENDSEVEKISETFEQLFNDPQFELSGVCAKASCSPEGGWEMNRKLSEKRAEAVSKLLKTMNEGKDIDIDFESEGENWNMLDSLVRNSGTIPEKDKKAYFALVSENNLDRREEKMRKIKSFPEIRDSLYPLLRRVKLEFRLTRKNMLKDTIHTTEIDTTYMAGVEALVNRDYKKAAEKLQGYKDSNAALAYIALGYNATALDILNKTADSPAKNYLLAVIYSRKGEDALAVEHFIKACTENPSFIHRGNLDPEISSLTKRYELNL